MVKVKIKNGFILFFDVLLGKTLDDSNLAG